jgi:hypothetical protein
MRDGRTRIKSEVLGIHQVNLIVSPTLAMVWGSGFSGLHRPFVSDVIHQKALERRG